MTPEQKQKWIEALRSGKYKQGRGKLCEKGEYCCLGVLLDVLAPEKWEDVPNKPYAVHSWSDEEGTELETTGLQMTGMRAKTMEHLIHLNDGWDGAVPSGETQVSIEAQSFVQIADYIEQNLPPSTTSSVEHK
jgi:hypothetical protein